MAGSEGASHTSLHHPTPQWGVEPFPQRSTNPPCLCHSWRQRGLNPNGAQTQSRGAKDTAVGGGEVLVEHPVEDVGDVSLEGVSCAGVDVLLRHFPKGHGGALRKRRREEELSACGPTVGPEVAKRYLQDVEGSAHVSAREGHQRLHPILTHVHPGVGDGAAAPGPGGEQGTAGPPISPLLLDDVLQPGHHQLWGEGPEAEAGAAGLQGRDDLGEVVADEAKAGVLGELLDHCMRAGERGWSPWLQPPVMRGNQECHPSPLTSSQSILCILCHGISFIQDDELEAFPGTERDEGALLPAASRRLQGWGLMAHGDASSQCGSTLCTLFPFGPASMLPRCPRTAVLICFSLSLPPASCSSPPTSVPPTHLKMVLVLAKLRMGPRTMSMPRSSDAFSCGDGGSGGGVGFQS